MDNAFPSPYGVWVVSTTEEENDDGEKVSVPLRGVGCFIGVGWAIQTILCFRPLTGCGLFP